MKTAAEYMYHPESHWLNMARGFEHKLRQTMNHLIFSPAAQISSNVKPLDFWDLFSQGIIALDEQNREDFQSFSEFKNLESKILKQRIESYCAVNGIKEIPTIAKVKAIMFLEVKFRQISHDIASENQSKYLQKMFSKESYESGTKELNDYQESFTLSIKEEIIRDNKSISSLNTETSSTVEDKVRKLGSLKMKKSDDTRQMKALVIQLYYYYLSRYQEFLELNINSGNEERDQKKISFSEVPDDAIKCDEHIEHYLKAFRTEVEQRTIVNYPESVYDLVVKCKKQLDLIKSEVGVNHELYLKSSVSVIHLSTDTLFEIIEHPVTEILMAPMDGLKLGKNLFEECDVVFNEINKIEMDSISKCGFNARKGYFESLRQLV